jgi:hypothetical protein
MKLILDKMAAEAGVRVQLHTCVVAAARDTTNRLTTIITESKSGRQAWAGQAFIDATGDGDVAAQAGCGYDYGHPETGETQPMTLMALLTGIRLPDVERFVAGGLESPGPTKPGRYRSATQALLAELKRAGVTPSYTGPSLACIHDDVFTLMANHEYGVSALDAAQITAATTNARSELHRLVAALRTLGDPWTGLRIVATGAQIGVRDGRRIHGRYKVTEADLLSGRRHEDAVCRAYSGIDVHALSADEGGYLNDASDIERKRTHPYDIPMRALIARDVDGLLLAGRCISGDFLAHASYRVTGNAVAMGQAAGVAAALAARSGKMPHDLPWTQVSDGINAIGVAATATV